MSYELSRHHRGCLYLFGFILEFIYFHVEELDPLDHGSNCLIALSPFRVCSVIELPSLSLSDI